ncbi:hypothetical protein B0H13DRAFT_1971481 [Mycena leptocephala]|nr:hypothetical protein B0H13DRAFT_1971481 [Mycena leptocephala]
MPKRRPAAAARHRAKRKAYVEELIPFDVVPRTRDCDDTSTDREYKRRKIDTDGNGEEVYIGEHAEPPGSSQYVLARPPRSPSPTRLSTHTRITTTPSLCPCQFQSSTLRCTSPTRAPSPFRTTTPTAPPHIRARKRAWTRPRAPVHPPAIQVRRTRPSTSMGMLDSKPMSTMSTTAGARTPRASVGRARA